MKLNGKKVEGVNIEIIVIPRGGKDNEDIIFHATAVMDYEPFDKMCPAPKPPSKVLKGGGREYLLDDPTYKDAIKIYHERRTAWMILQSLKATPNLEWETVEDGNHRTWTNWEKELKDAGFNSVEIQRIMVGVMNANCLNEARISEARENFLRGRQAEESESSGQSTEQPST